MAEIEKYASGSWQGDLKSGVGNASTESGRVQNIPMTFASRFQDGKGSNPEELIAAAHASCFSMALSKGLSDAGHPPDAINTRATVTLRTGGDGARITKIHLQTEGYVAGMDEAAFKEAAQEAKETCPVSLLLLPGLEEMTLEARLLQEQPAPGQAEGEEAVVEENLGKM